MTPEIRLPALMAGGIGVLLLGVGLGFWISQSQTDAPAMPPADVVSEAPVPAPAAVQTREEDKELVDLCSPLTQPRTEEYGLIRVHTLREDNLCMLEISTSNGEAMQDYDILSRASGSWMGIDAQYADLDNDAVPELLLSGDSGGSGGYHDSWIVSQMPHPRLIEFPAACAVRVVEAPGGGRALRTCVLGLEISGLDCNACRPKPPVFYKYSSGQFTQVNPQFVSEYDASIAEMAKQLDTDKLNAFVASKDAQDPAYGSDTRQIVIHMAVYYQYSGRREEARRTFEQMWPAWDREAIIEEVMGPDPPTSN
jgi:hypothetical protein